VVGFFAGVAWGPMNAFGNIGYLSSLGMLPVFIVTSVALPVFIRKQYPKDFSLLLHGVSPALSVLIFLAAIWLSINPWPSPPLNIFPWVVVAVIVLAVIWGAVLKGRNSPMFKRLGAVLFMEGDAPPHLRDVA
jgi:hypothetical protein